MSDLTSAIQEILGNQLKESNVDVVAIPAHADRMVKIRTIEELISDFDRNEDGQILGYFVQVKPNAAPAKAKATPETPPPPPKMGSDGMYLANGKLNVPYLFRNAEILASTGEYALARNILKAIVQSGEKTAKALLEIGKCFEAEGKSREAQGNYEESIAYQPSIDTYQRLVSLLVADKKDQQAAETLERALNMKDLSKSVAFELHKAAGNCWSRVPNTHKAEKHFHRALEIDPAADEIHSNLGALYLQMGKIAESKRCFQDAIATNPRNSKALSGLGTCAYSENDKRASHDYFAKALDIDLNNPNSIYHLVKCAFEIKSYATSARILEDYVQIAPINANLLYSLAGLQYHLGRLKEAKASTKKILELNAGHRGALDLLDLIDRYSGGNA